MVGARTASSSLEFRGDDALLSLLLDTRTVPSCANWVNDQLSQASLPESRTVTTARSWPTSAFGAVADIFREAEFARPIRSPYRNVVPVVGQRTLGSTKL